MSSSVAVLAVLWGALLVGPGVAFNLTLIHTNDVHSHFIQFNAFGGRCPDEHVEQNKCFGGFARQVTKAKEVRSSNDNVLFLNGGDFYQGTVWYTLHRWQIVADLVNKLAIDAMSLGNHEFDDGLKGLFPYLRKLRTKVVVCNVNSSKVPEFGELVAPSTILEVGGEKIGVIGYLTPETKQLSSAGDLEFEDEVECIKREAKRLSEEEGLDKIMAVGHSGFAVDQSIAREVPQVDVVVGGHTNTFLYTGDPPSTEVAQGPYPVVVERDDGSRALVVQDFAFGKYLGHLQLTFDKEGRVENWSGNPILLDGTVAQDPETLELLEPYGEEVKNRVRQTVGQTNVLLRGDRPLCRMEECNMGNFLADASLDYFVEKPTEEGWNFVAIALWNSGGIRSSVDERLNGGNVTLEDVLAIAPFGNTMDVVALRGKHLRAVLEHSVREYDVDAVDPPGSLLQVSGLWVTFNVSNPPGSRVAEVWARCAKCRVPKFQLLEEEEVYEVVMNTYMAKGGDGFSLIPENAISNRNTDELDVDIITRYANKRSPITTGLEGRIKIISAKTKNNSETSDAMSPQSEVETKTKPLTATEATEEKLTIKSEEPSNPETTKATLTDTSTSKEPSNADEEKSSVEKISGALQKIPGAIQELPGQIMKLNPFANSKEEKPKDDNLFGKIFKL